MMEKILCLRDLGHDTFWRIVHDTAQLPSHTYTSDVLRPKQALILTVGTVQANIQIFAKAITDLGGTVVPCVLDTMPASAASLAEIAFQHAPKADICICCGVPQPMLQAFAEAMPIIVLNGASHEARPVAVMGDLALMRTFMPDMDNMRIGWVGGATALAHSLIEASMYVPYELFMALPEWGEPDRNLLGLALSTGSKIFLTREVHLAVDEAHFVYVGAGPEGTSPSEGAAQAHKAGQDLHALQTGMRVDDSVMALAAPHARVLLGAPWTPACRAPQALVEGPSSLCQQQQDYSLRVAKCLLTWLMHN